MPKSDGLQTLHAPLPPNYNDTSVLTRNQRAKRRNALKTNQSSEEFF